MSPRRRPPVAEELRWWSNRIVRLGAIVGALVVIVGALLAMQTWFDGKYASAADVQQIQSDILELRRDQLRRQRDELQVKRQRTPEEEIRLSQTQDALRDIERRIRRAEDKHR